MPSWLITGASRGIGLSIVEDLLADEANFVIATARNISSEGLQRLAHKYSSDRIALVQLDITKADHITKAVDEASKLLPDGLDYFVSNAGVHPQPMTSFDDLDLELFTEEIKFNTVNVVGVTRAFLPLIKKSSTKKIAFITSILGSITLGGDWPYISNSYSISKAALNMLARKWGAVLKKEGIAVGLIHPGYAQTEIGDAIKEWMDTYAPGVRQITTKESSEGVLKVVKGLPVDSTTSYYNYDGSILPW